MNQLINKNYKYYHHFYCYKHDKGHIIKTNSKYIPKYKNHCGNKCNVFYHGLNGKDSYYYLKLNGGFFKNNFYKKRNIYYV